MKQSEPTPEWALSPRQRYDDGTEDPRYVFLNGAWRGPVDPITVKVIAQALEIERPAAWRD